MVTRKQIVPTVQSLYNYTHFVIVLACGSKERF